MSAHIYERKTEERAALWESSLMVAWRVTPTDCTTGPEVCAAAEREKEPRGAA